LVAAKEKSCLYRQTRNFAPAAGGVRAAMRVRKKWAEPAKGWLQAQRQVQL